MNYKWHIAFIILSIICFSCNHELKEKNEKESSYKKKEVKTNSFVNSSKDTLSASQLLLYSKDTLKLLRNDIYARNGYVFKKNELAEHYKLKNWYKPKHAQVEKLFTDLEKNNIQLIKSIEYQRQAEYTNEVYIQGMPSFHFKGMHLKTIAYDLDKLTEEGYDVDTVINPHLLPTKKSLFTNYNTKNTFFFVVSLNVENVMITDNTADLLNFILLNLDTTDYIVERPIIKGIGIHGNYEHNITILRLLKHYPVHIFVDSNRIESKLNFWKIDSDNECSGDFPNLFVDTNNITDFIKPIDENYMHRGNMDPNYGFGFITTDGLQPAWDTNLSAEKSVIKIKSKLNGTIEGVAIDLNNDAINDLFWYNQYSNRSDTKRITRLFVNIDGVWVMRYVDYFHGCY